MMGSVENMRNTGFAAPLLLISAFGEALSLSIAKAVFCRTTISFPRVICFGNEIRTNRASHVVAINCAFDADINVCWKRDIDV